MSRFREGQVVENQQGLDYFLALKGQKGPEELCRGGVQRSTTKRGRKPRRWGQEQSLLAGSGVLCSYLVRVDELPHCDVDDRFGHRHHLRVLIHAKPLLWLRDAASSRDEPPAERNLFSQPQSPATGS